MTPIPYIVQVERRTQQYVKAGMARNLAIVRAAAEVRREMDKESEPKGLVRT